jgi:Topoisomerase IA
MRLFIAEKPELGRAIAEAIGGGKKSKGFIDCGEDQITWCFGHLLELSKPMDKNWSLNKLPRRLIPWKKQPIPDKKEQLDLILNFLNRADSVVHAGDPDAEGQLLVDEILQLAKYNGPVKRVLINDNTPALVKKALESLKDNSEFSGLSSSAEARSVGDLIYGINMTEAYTVAARQSGFDGLISVGRVQTPILGLVVRRDREFSEHTSAAYFTITGVFSINDAVFNGIYKIKPDDPGLDDNGRLTDRAFCDGVAASIMNKDAIVMYADTTIKQTPPPLPYNLLSLQSDASRLLKLKPDAVKKITQSLREKYRCITYNRSDSEYLSDEQHADATVVLAAIAATDESLHIEIQEANPEIKSRAFNSAKVTAHHAIIPTQATPDFSQLTKDEQNIYHLIARAYVAQFHPNYEYEQTKIETAVEGHTFTCTTHVPLSPGWRKLYGKDAANTDDSGDSAFSLKNLANGDKGTCKEGIVAEKHTKPRPLYTFSSLLDDLTRVAKYVKDESLRKVLIEKDAGKEGEHGGIGTPATRDEIIKTLFERGFIETQKGKGSAENVVSTSKGKEIYDLIPDVAKYPDMTALWHQELKEIENGARTIDAFLEGLMAYVEREIDKIKTDGLKINVASHECPLCGKPMYRRKARTGNFFWGCSNYPACKSTLPDSGGEPGEAQPLFECPVCGKSDGGTLILRKVGSGEFFGCSRYRDGCKTTYKVKDGKPDFSIKTTIISQTYLCLKCGAGLVMRESKKGTFWGCSKYPQCKTTYPDLNGKPKVNEKGG